MGLLDRLRNIVAKPPASPDSDIPPSPPAANDLSASLGVGIADDHLSGWFNGNQLYKSFPIFPEDVVIDAGCGDGAHSHFVGRQGAHVILCDILPEKVASAASMVRETAAREVTEVVTTSESIPLPDGIATKIICTEVLEHVGDPTLFMSELARLVRPGGALALSVPHPRSEELQKLVAPPLYFEPPHHVRIVTPEQFKALVTDAGLEVESHEVFGFYSAMTLAFFWTCNTSLEARDHPLLNAWAQTWGALLGMDGGVELKRKLDSFLPSRQIIIARKPA